MDVISLLRFIATIAITNSHLDHLYPASMSYLATGGSFGNALFFFCSGYALALSKMEGFGKWFLKRVLRILPAVVVFRLFSYLVLGDPGRLALTTGYWFLDAIIVFYAVFYFVMKYLKGHLWMVIVLLFIPVCGVYVYLKSQGAVTIDDNTLGLNWYYYFGIMLMGAWMSTSEKLLLRSVEYGRVYLVLFPVSFALMYGYKAATKGAFMGYSELLVPVLLFVTAFTMYGAGRYLAPKFSDGSWVTRTVVYVAKLTLDIYIVQFAIIAFCKRFDFPMNIAIALPTIFVGGIVLNYISGKIFDYLKKVLAL